MSQFPSVNVIDPVAPSTMQGIGIGSQNLNEAEQRALEAARIRAQAAVAEKSADLEATRIEQEAELARQQMETQEKNAQLAADTAVKTQGMTNESFAAQNASQERMNAERIAAEQAIHEKRMQAQTAADKRSQELTLRLQMNALKSGAEASQVKMQTLEALAQNEVAKQRLMDEGVKTDAQINAQQLKMAQQIDVMARTTQKAEETGLSANKVGMQALQFAEAGAKSFEEKAAEGIGGGPIGKAVGSAVQGAFAAVGMGGQGQEGIAASVPEVTREFAGKWADGVSDFLAATAGVKNPDLVRGAFQDIMKSGLLIQQEQETHVANGTDSDTQALALARDRLWSFIEEKVTLLEKEGVARQTVFAAIEDLTHGLEGRIAERKVEQLREGEAYFPGTNELREIQNQGLMKLKGAAQLLNASGVGRVQRAFDSSEVRNALLASIAQYGDVEHTQAFLADNPDVLPSFVEAAVKKLDQGQMSQLLQNKKTLAERARELGEEYIRTQMKGAKSEADLFGGQIEGVKELIGDLDTMF